MLGAVLVFMILAALTGGQLESPTPRCAISCWENTKYVSSCLGDDSCLCNESDFLQSVFRCVYSQCDTVHFGIALHHSLSRCSDIGGQSIIAPIANHDSLRRREAEYLGGGEVVESGSVFGFPTQSVGFLTQSVSVSYPTTSAEIPSFNLDTNTVSPSIPASTSVTSTSQTSTGLESSPSSGPVLFTGGASENELNIALPVMVTIAALYLAL